MDVVRWGIIGCGDVTEKKSGPGFQKARGAQLVAVMRRNGELARDYAQRHGVPRWYDDADRLIADPEVDAVYIATPPTTHVEYIRLVADAGKPVYCEKPMGIGFDASKEAVELCASRGVPLHVAYYRRGMEKYRAIGSLLEKKAIGSVRHVHVSLHAQSLAADATGELPWRVRPELSGGGLILDVGSHGLDLLDFYFGPITAVHGIATNQGGSYAVEDMVTGTWLHESGVHGSGSWCFTADREEDFVHIYGSAGRISFSVLDVAGPVIVETGAGSEEILFAVPEHVQQPLIQIVTDDLLGRDTSPSTGASALRTDRVLEELRKGA
ncbi:MAG: gfo/Idh/MocA family oxidoreductase [Spirochaetaceae bacterium]|nr:MAG: gfo/Idh/MocA family oxidoreductase [Spirochaetaceae bacterium]